MSPKDGLWWTYAASSPVENRVSSTATPEPSASQVSPGCLRRGEWSRITAMVNTSSTTPTGHRAMFHAVTRPSLQP